MEFSKTAVRITVPDVLEVIGIPEATYHDHIQQCKKEDPDQKWKDIIQELFKKHKGRYGYRRIHSELKAQVHVINHKKVQRIMRVLDLKCGKFTRKIPL
ncbi:IS3 family transposase [Bacillus massiliglaciei]|uniref:IS3 family transposase n=1 Tax=Bacillus massiliglaciei TaxID=1816693 RepID=UPI0018FE0852|nr:IS3 family transposase [Bacillus massiliglaciei]